MAFLFSDAFILYIHPDNFTTFVYHVNYFPEHFLIHYKHYNKALIYSKYKRHALSGADQLLSDRRGADFPGGGVHWCVTKEAARVPIF